MFQTSLQLTTQQQMIYSFVRLKIITTSGGRPQETRVAALSPAASVHVIPQPQVPVKGQLTD